MSVILYLQNNFYSVTFFKWHFSQHLPPPITRFFRKLKSETFFNISKKKKVFRFAERKKELFTRPSHGNNLWRFSKIKDLIAARPQVLWLQADNHFKNFKLFNFKFQPLCTKSSQWHSTPLTSCCLRFSPPPLSFLSCVHFQSARITYNGGTSISTKQPQKSLAVFMFLGQCVGNYRWRNFLNGKNGSLGNFHIQQ